MLCALVAWNCDSNVSNVNFVLPVSSLVKVCLWVPYIELPSLICSHYLQGLKAKEKYCKMQGYNWVHVELTADYSDCPAIPGICM
jgi:hypothetical protein